MFKGSLGDALQITVSVSCLTVLLLSSVVYILFYARTREKSFYSGTLMTLDVAFFVLFEILIMVQGWYGNTVLGRYLHRYEQITIFILYFLLPYFLYTSFPAKGIMNGFLKVFMWFGIASGLFFTALTLIKPDLMISINEASTTPSLTPGDFTRGLEGPMYMYRDIFLAAFIAVSLVYSISYTVKDKGRLKSLMLMLGIVCSMLGGIDDLQYFYTGRNFIFNGLRFSRFTFGSTLMMLFFLSAVFIDYFSTHNKLLKSNQSLRLTESRYKLLLEVAEEIVFTLSPELEIISANQKGEKLFELGEAPVNFLNCIYKSDVESEINNQFIHEQLMNLRDPGSRTSFNTYLRDPVTFEPVEYHFRFDCFQAESLELIGRAWPASGSSLSGFIDNERLSLTVDNYVVLVGDVVDRLTSNLKKYLEKSDIMMVKMGLQEMIVNAMEHGNLDVSFDEKTRAQEEGRLFDFMKEKRLNPECRDRKVIIDYSLDDKKVIYRITDMGKGFDYAKIMERVKNEVNQQGLLHGRGILMTSAVFDRMEYNKKGNQVLLVKQLI